MAGPKIVAIIPAAGIGSRMQHPQAKQYLPLGKLTVLEHAVKHLLAAQQIAQVIIALREDDQQFWQLPLAQHNKITTVIGGSERADSVLAALQKVPEDTDWVLVHDAARPCLSEDELALLWHWLIDSACNDGAILALPLYDTIKRVKEQGEIAMTVDRRQLWRALTPQLFPFVLLKQGLTQALVQQQTVTDEASAMELLGYHPRLLCGKRSNIKITTHDDLALAHFYLSQQDDN